ncbi:MAG TPA: hydroxyacylglutathione hydrolase [Gammaproteobacteria bacterium]|jgi:hydroxyacylglutathione hydrolase
MFTVRPVPAFKDNYIWLIVNDESRRAAIVDPGDAAPVFAALDELRLEPVAILATHHHGDHVGGIAALIERHPVPVFGPAGEHIPGRTRAMREDDLAEIGDLGASFRVLDIPGHTAGHIAFVGHGMAFVGDTLFTAGCGRLFEGTAAQMHASLSRLAALPPQTLIYCGHEYTQANLRFAAAVEPGNVDIRARISACEDLRKRGLPTVPAPLQLELLTNPFLRVGTAAVRSAAERAAGHALGGDAEIFGAVRRWKDAF